MEEVAKDEKTEGDAVESESKEEEGAIPPEKAGPVTESVDGSGNRREEDEIILR